MQIWPKPSYIRKVLSVGISAALITTQVTISPGLVQAVAAQKQIPITPPLPNIWQSRSLKSLNHRSRLKSGLGQNRPAQKKSTPHAQVPYPFIF